MNEELDINKGDTPIIEIYNNRNVDSNKSEQPSSSLREQKNDTPHLQKERWENYVKNVLNNEIIGSKAGYIRIYVGLGGTQDYGESV